MAVILIFQKEKDEYLENSLWIVELCSQRILFHCFYLINTKALVREFYLKCFVLFSLYSHSLLLWEWISTCYGKVVIMRSSAAVQKRKGNGQNPHGRRCLSVTISSGRCSRLCQEAASVWAPGSSVNPEAAQGKRLNKLRWSLLMDVT